MSEVWLISAPGENTPQKTWDTLNRATSAENLSANYKFNIPELRVRELRVTQAHLRIHMMMCAYRDTLTHMHTHIHAHARTHTHTHN